MIFAAPPIARYYSDWYDMLPVLAQSFFVRDIVLPEGAEPDTLEEVSVHSLLD